VGIAEIFASSTFLFVYSGLLVLLTAGAIFRDRMSLAAEAKASADVVRMVEASASAAEAQLVALNEATGARILTNEACRRDDLARPWRTPATATARATAQYLGAMAATPPERHALEGLRPAAGLIEDEYHRLRLGLSGFGDFIIRLALLGTFMGLIAALTIASANIGAVNGPAAVQSMRDFIQVLLATAANKFWISAVGIACALVAQVWRAASERDAHIVRLGDAFDRALTDPAIAAAWCPPGAGQAETDLQLARQAVAARIARLDVAPLEDAIAETAAAIKANAKASVISFGPAPRSAE
jgi:hypothetical protein